MTVTIPNATITMPVTTTEFVPVEVTYLKAGIDGDPVADGYTGEMAFEVEGVAPSSWIAAAWEQSAEASWLIALVGPQGAIALAAGTYVVWYKLASTTAPEVPCRPAGILIVEDVA